MTTMKEYEKDDDMYIDEEITEENDCSININMNISQVRTEIGFRTLVEGFDQIGRAHV